MNHFKNHNGFLLIEAVFALCIAAALLTPLYNGIGSLLHKVIFNTNQIAAFYEAKNFFFKTYYTSLYNHEQKEKKEKNDKIVIQAANNYQLIYQETNKHPESVFKNNHYLSRITIQYKWESLFNNGQESLSFFVVKTAKDTK